LKKSNIVIKFFFEGFLFSGEKLIVYKKREQLLRLLFTYFIVEIVPWLFFHVPTFLLFFDLSFFMISGFYGPHIYWSFDDLPICISSVI
jgi:hypothetical protein